MSEVTFLQAFIAFITLYILHQGEVELIQPHTHSSPQILTVGDAFGGLVLCQF
jgi:hypothetical protein